MLWYVCCWCWRACLLSPGCIVVSLRAQGCLPGVSGRVSSLTESSRVGVLLVLEGVSPLSRMYSSLLESSRVCVAGVRGLVSSLQSVSSLLDSSRVGVLLVSEGLALLSLRAQRRVCCWCLRACCLSP